MQGWVKALVVVGAVGGAAGGAYVLVGRKVAARQYAVPGLSTGGKPATKPAPPTALQKAKDKSNKLAADAKRKFAAALGGASNAAPAALAAGVGAAGLGATVGGTVGTGVGAGLGALGLGFGAAAGAPIGGAVGTAAGAVGGFVLAGGTVLGIGALQGAAQG